MTIARTPSLKASARPVSECGTSSPSCASSRNYRFSANVQVILDADTKLVVATARPAPGNKADAHVWRNSSLPAQGQGVTVLGDGAYINTGLVVPHRKRPGGHSSRVRKRTISSIAKSEPAWNMPSPA